MEQLKGHVSDELLNQLSNIKHHYIESEHPDHHWHLLKTNNETVLDLGCGFHLMEPGWETTPGYFINKGAKKVIGIDPENNDIIQFGSLYPDHEFYTDLIDSVDKLNYFINNYQNLALSLFAPISLFFIANLGLTISNRPIILHSTYKKIIAAFFIGILVFVFSPNKSNEMLIFTFVPLAFAMTIFVETPQSKAKTELFFLAVVGCSLFAFFSQL
jgi:hypothetical protein